MNARPAHIKRRALYTAIPLLALVLSGLCCPAQHSHRHRHPARTNTNRLPDSVSTSEEEIHPWSSNDDPPPAVKPPSDSISSDTTASATTAPPDQDGSASKDTATDEPTVLRAVPDSTVRRLKRDKDFAYANDPDYWKKEDVKEEEESPFMRFLQRLFSSTGFRYTLYTLAALVLLYALYRIVAENNLRFFYRSPVKAAGPEEDEIMLPEEDLDQRLAKALAENGFRLATRYLYLKALRHLDRQQLIRLHAQTTDEEYVRQLSNHPAGQQFRALTAHYERVWYGGFSPDEEQFGKLQAYFTAFYTFIARQPAS